jgi:hypothetical protein
MYTSQRDIIQIGVTFVVITTVSLYKVITTLVCDELNGL